MTPEEKARLKQARRSRNIVLGLVLVFLVALFYAITIVRLGE